MKKLNELQKVKLLEETVETGSLEELNAVLDTYQPFEFTAQALGMAAAHRGIAFVQALAAHGATFSYEHSAVLNRKYGMSFKGGTSTGTHHTRYYLTQRYGTPRLPLKDRMDVARFLAEHPALGASMDEILFEALTCNDLEFADALMEMGVTLQDTPPCYYESPGGEVNTVVTYLDVVTSGVQSIYWTDYMTALSQLKAEALCPVLERFHALAASGGRKLAVTTKMFDMLNWNAESLAFAMTHMNLEKINQKKILEMAVQKDASSVLANMAETGWCPKPAALKTLIALAQEHQSREALAWLMDFQNRTVDVQAEMAKEAEKQMRSLTEDPNSVSVLKKSWNYEKLEDGTLRITGYKGQETEVTVPARIGKNEVSAIGGGAFSPTQIRCRNADVRKKITSVRLPETITQIAEMAFYECDQLQDIWIPASVNKLGKSCLSGYWAFKMKMTVHTEEGSTAAKWVGKEHSDRFCALAFDYKETV